MTKYIYGNHISITVSGFDAIMDKFNSILAGKLLVCVDETAVVDKKQYIKDFDKFKAQITGSTIEIEKKGKDKYTVSNHCNYAITSNHNGVKLESGDRRYYCGECSDTYKGNFEYFTNLVSKCFNQECGNIFYSYLRSGFVLTPLHPIPMTNLKQSIIEDATPKHKVFLKDVFTQSNIALPSSIFHWDSIECKFYFVRKDLYGVYSNWCESTLIKDTIFCRELTKVNGVLDAGRRNVNGIRTYRSYLDPSLYNSTIIINTLGNINYLSSLILK